MKFPRQHLHSQALILDQHIVLPYRNPHQFLIKEIRKGNPERTHRLPRNQFRAKTHQHKPNKTPREKKGLVVRFCSFLSLGHSARIFFAECSVRLAASGAYIIHRETPTASPGFRETRERIRSRVCMQCVLFVRERVLCAKISGPHSPPAPREKRLCSGKPLRRDRSLRFFEHSVYNILCRVSFARESLRLGIFYTLMRFVFVCYVIIFTIFV